MGVEGCACDRHADAVRRPWQPDVRRVAPPLVQARVDGSCRDGVTPEGGAEHGGHPTKLRIAFIDAQHV